MNALVDHDETPPRAEAVGRRARLGDCAVLDVVFALGQVLGPEARP